MNPIHVDLLEETWKHTVARHDTRMVESLIEVLKRYLGSSPVTDVCKNTFERSRSRDTGGGYITNEASVGSTGGHTQPKSKLTFIST